ncbi:MAG: HAD family hydrolase [Congregibacter sp.]
MPIQVITFDLDNTLWDVEPAILRAEAAQREWFLEHRPGVMERIDHEALWDLKKTLWKAHPELAHHVSDMRKLLLTQMQLDAGYSPVEAEDGAELAFNVFLAERQTVELYVDALTVLEQLAERYTLGALTNGNADVYKTDAGEYFDFAFLAEDIGASKPAPDMFHAALNTTGRPAREFIHVGDNPEHDILGALGVGMHAVWLRSESDPHPDEWPHAQQPNAVINAIGELPEAVELIASRIDDSTAIQSG